MMGLPRGPKSFKIGLVVLIQYRLWRTASHPPTQPASQPASQPRWRSKYRAYAQVKMRLQHLYFVCTVYAYDLWFNGACLKKSSNFTSTSQKKSCSTRLSQYVVVVDREWLSLIAVIYFHTSTFLTQVSALCTGFLGWVTITRKSIPRISFPRKWRGRARLLNRDEPGEESTCDIVVRVWSRQ